jgi:hypothetical protein
MRFFALPKSSNKSEDSECQWWIWNTSIFHYDAFRGVFHSMLINKRTFSIPSFLCLGTIFERWQVRHIYRVVTGESIAGINLRKTAFVAQCVLPYPLTIEASRLGCFFRRWKKVKGDCSWRGNISFSLNFCLELNTQKSLDYKNTSVEMYWKHMFWSVDFVNQEVCRSTDCQSLQFDCRKITLSTELTDKPDR